MLKISQLLLVCYLASTGFAAELKNARYQQVEEWRLWKNVHGKSYVSHKEDLEKHIVWLSNKEYIEQHNKNAHVFGFTLAMNHLGDMVGARYLLQLLVC